MSCMRKPLIFSADYYIIDLLQHWFEIQSLLKNSNRSKMWLFMAVVCFILQVTDSQPLSQTHLNPQEFMTISEIILYWGYPSEEYQVLTADGYYLQVNRIPYGANSSAKTGPRPVVLVVHGVLAEGRHWIANLPSNSPAFVLADAGYDVWILNCRGTTWSRRNQNLSISQEKFWDFRLINLQCCNRNVSVLIVPGFHEMGIYDVPATIHFILQKTQQDGLYYIGHSQGSAVGLIALSVKPELGKYVKLLMLFAPPYSFVFGTNYGIVGMMKLVPAELIKIIFQNKEVCVLNNKLKTIRAHLCSHAVIEELCLQLAGFNTKHLNVSRADVYLGIYPDYTSVKTVLHWKQVGESHEFKYYDYGYFKNIAVYNKTVPPFYKIEDMTVRTAVWSGAEDATVDPRNVEQLLPRIKHLVFYKKVPSWGHQDFIWALDAPKQLYPDVLNLLHKYK